MNCENCEQEIKDKVGSGRFCSIKCARSFASKNCREEKNKKISESLKAKSSVSQKGKIFLKKLEKSCVKCDQKFFTSMPFAKYCDAHRKKIVQDVKKFVPPQQIPPEKIEQRAQKSKIMKEWWTDERRKKQSEKMKEVVSSNPNSYKGRNRGKVRKVEIDGIVVTGNWEAEFYRWAKEKNLNPQQCDRGFTYHFSGERTYYPDFWLGSIDVYVEVKGYETEKDRCKWSQFPKSLVIIKRKEIDEIKNSTFTVEKLVEPLGLEPRTG